MWVGTEIGALNRFDRTSGRFTAYRTPGRNYVYSIFEDRAGILWLGGHGGVTSVRPSHGAVHRPCPRRREIPAPSATTKCGPFMRISRAGCGSPRPAVSTSSTGLAGRSRASPRKDGLAGNSVRAILEDGEGYLWLATDGGLSRFHPKTRTFRNFTESDGLPGNLLNPYGLQGTWQSPAGEMVLGSTNGLTTFFPDRLSPNPYVPPVVLTELELFNKRVEPWQGLAAAAADLGHGFADAHARAEHLHARILGPQLFRSREEPVPVSAGGTRARMERGGQPAAPGHLHQPSSRTVHFRVQASTNGEVWSEPGVRLALTVLPPWWATWWFRTIAGTLTVV